MYHGSTSRNGHVISCDILVDALTDIERATAPNQRSGAEGSPDVSGHV